MNAEQSAGLEIFNDPRSKRIRKTRFQNAALTQKIDFNDPTTFVQMSVPDTFIEPMTTEEWDLFNDTKEKIKKIHTDIGDRRWEEFGRYGMVSFEPYISRTLHPKNRGRLEKALIRAKAFSVQDVVGLDEAHFLQASKLGNSDRHITLNNFRELKCNAEQIVMQYEAVPRLEPQVA